MQIVSKCGSHHSKLMEGNAFYSSETCSKPNFYFKLCESSSITDLSLVMLPKLKINDIRNLLWFLFKVFA